MKLSKIKKYLITSENKVIDVIKKLNINKYKTVIVIDKLNGLIGLNFKSSSNRIQIF